MKFIIEKRRVLVINREDDVERKWKLDGKDTRRTDEYKYLGFVLNTSGCEKAKK